MGSHDSNTKLNAETYPADGYTKQGVQFSPASPGGKSGKRSQVDRAANATSLLRQADGLDIDLPPEMVNLIRDGFGSNLHSEDCFDSFIGLLELVRVLRSDLTPYEPASPVIRNIEGWILGMVWETGTSKDIESN